MNEELKKQLEIINGYLENNKIDDAIHAFSAYNRSNATKADKDILNDALIKGIHQCNKKNRKKTDKPPKFKPNKHKRITRRQHRYWHIV